MKLFLFVLVCVFLQANAWIGRIQSDPDKAPADGCYTTYDNIGLLKQDEVKRIENKCAIAKCKDGEVLLTGCAPVGTLPPCRIEEGDLSKPFPQCCFEEVCPLGYKRDLQSLSDSGNERVSD